MKHQFSCTDKLQTGKTGANNHENVKDEDENSDFEKFWQGNHHSTLKVFPELFTYVLEETFYTEVHLH